MNCPECKSTSVIKQGTYKRRTPTRQEFQQYKCNDCWKVFHDTTPLNCIQKVEVAGNPDQIPLSHTESNTAVMSATTSPVEQPKGNCQ